MNTEIEKIILESDYTELTPSQLDSIHEWASSEDEFSTLQQILRSAITLNEEVVPSPQLKSSLMETFQNKHANTAAVGGASANNRQDQRNVLFLRLKYVASAAALFLIFLMIYPLMKTANDNHTLAKSEVGKTVKHKNKGAQKANPIEKTENPVSERNNIPNVTESPVQLAINQNVRVNSTATNVSIPSEDTFIGTHTLSADNQVLISSDFTMAPTPSFSNAAGSSSNITAFHSDRIAVADLPQKSRQVIHDRPELLDLLHTSF